MFEKASRMKLRFQFKGICTVEDLWDMSVEDLDTLFKSLNSRVKLAKEESLLQLKTKEDEILELQIEIIKYVVTVKVAEAEARKVAREKKLQREKIKEILANKQDAALQNLTPEELQKKLDELGV